MQVRVRKKARKSKTLLTYDSIRTTMDQTHMNLHWNWSSVVLSESHVCSCKAKPPQSMKAYSVAMTKR